MNDCLSIPVSVLKIQVLPFTCTSFIVILILYKRFESFGDDKSKYLPLFFLSSTNISEGRLGRHVVKQGHRLLTTSLTSLT